MKLLLLLLIVSITKRTSSAWLTTRTPRGLALTTRQYLLNNDGNNDSNGVVNSDKKSLTSKSKTDKLLENARKLREEAELLEKQNKEDAARLSMDNTERSSDSITTNSNVSSNNVFLKNKNYEFASPDIKMPSIQEKQGEITVKKEAVSNRLTTLLEDRASSTARKELIQKLSSGNRTPTNKRLPPKTTATSDESTDAEVTTTIDGDNGKISWLISKDDDEIEIDMVLTQREKKNERAEKDAVLVGSNIAELKELPKLDSMYSQMKPWWKRWVLQTYGHTVAIQLTDDEEEQQLHETAYAMLLLEKFIDMKSNNIFELVDEVITEDGYFKEVVFARAKLLKDQLSGTDISAAAKSDNALTGTVNNSAVDHSSLPKEVKRSAQQFTKYEGLEKYPSVEELYSGIDMQYARGIVMEATRSFASNYKDPEDQKIYELAFAKMMAEIMKDIEKNHGFDRVKILMEAVKLDMDVVVEENKQKILNELRQMNEAAEDQQQQRMNPNVKVDVEENVQEKVYSEVERERLIEETLIQLSMSEVLPVKYFADDNNPSFPALTALIQAVIESIEYRTLDNDDLVQKIDERIALMEVSAESKQAFSELSILLKENAKVLRKIQNIIDMQIELMDNPSLLESNRSSPALTNYTNLSEQFDALNDTLISDGLIKTLMGTFAELEVLEDVDSAKSTVETFILSYFDPISRVNGPKISRTGAGEFQKTVLKDILSVTSVREVYGAYVFEGQPTMKYKSNWGEAIAERYANSSYNDEVGYTIVKNEIIPNFDEGIERAALDVMLGSSPAVVLFPKSWNSTVAATVADPIKNLWRSFVGSGSVLSSFVVAASCTGIFSDANGVLDDNSIPDYFFYLASVPILIQNLAAVMEKTTARLRDVEVSVSYIPALSIFSYGPRTTLVSMPKNRNDMFDITLAGIATSIGLSVAAMLVGLHYTEEASPDIIASYPLIPLSLLKVNTLVAQFLTSQFGDIFSQLSDPKYAESTVHLHWLVIVGALSFIGSVFQLIPLDNSVGSKLSFAALGRDTSQLITAIAGLTKLLFLIPMFFNVGGIASAVVPTRAKVLLDYILLSQLVSSDRDTQVAKDNLTEISDGRKYLYYIICGLLAFSFFPYGDLTQELLNNLQQISQYLQNLFNGGALPI